MTSEQPLRAGFACAERVGFHLRIGLADSHAVGANRGDAAGEQQDQANG
jgi:hypothetical protein